MNSQSRGHLVECFTLLGSLSYGWGLNDSTGRLHNRIVLLDKLKYFYKYESALKYKSLDLFFRQRFLSFIFLRVISPICRYNSSTKQHCDIAPLAE